MNRIKNLQEISYGDYKESIEILKGDKSKSATVEDFVKNYIDADIHKKSFNVNDLKRFTRPYYIAAMNVITWEQSSFYRENDRFQDIKHIEEALEILDAAVKQETGVSKYIKNFLIALGHSHSFDIGSLCSLDSKNFDAVTTLFTAIKSENRFDVWERLELLGYRSK